MKKHEAISKLENLKERAKPLLNMRSDSQEFNKWHRDTEVAIENVFGIGTRHSKDFKEIRYSPYIFTVGAPDSEFEEANRNGIKSAITTIESFIDEIKEYWNEDESAVTQPAEVGAVDNVKPSFTASIRLPVSCAPYIQTDQPLKSKMNTTFKICFMRC